MTLISMVFPRFSLKHTTSRFLGLFFALLVYAHVYTEQERTADFTLPLQIQGLQANLVLLSNPPQEVSLTLRGTGKQLVKLRMRPPEVVLDLAEARPGNVQRIISPADVLLPASAGAKVESILHPKVVTLNVDSLVTRSLPVQITQVGSIGRGFSLRTVLHTDPEQVLVQGPHSLVAPLLYLGTEPLNLGRFQESGTLMVGVQHDSILTIHPEEVTVMVDLIPTETRTLVLLVDALGGGLRDIRILPETGSVHLEGPVELLERLDPNQIRLWLEVENLPIGLHRIVPQISLPVENVEVRAIVPSEFLVDIGP